jgi:HAD superfamily hydrolase (TIGR01509 family)
MPALIAHEELNKIGHDLEQYRGELFKRKYLPIVRPFPRVRDLLLKMKEEGQQIALASSGKKDEVAVYKRIAHIDDLVETDTSADDADRSKPAPDIFEAAIKKLTPLTPAEMIVVGDTVYDAQAAAKAGLRTVGLLCGGSSADALRRAGCVAIYPDCAALFAEFDTSPLAR